MGIFESLENLQVSEGCFDEIMGLVEAYLKRLDSSSHIRNAYGTPEYSDETGKPLNKSAKLINKAAEVQSKELDKAAEVETKRAQERAKVDFPKSRLNKLAGVDSLDIIDRRSQFNSNAGRQDIDREIRELLKEHPIKKAK